MASADDVWDAAIKEAEFLHGLMPLMEEMEKNPIQYAKLLVWQAKRIKELENKS